MLYIYNIYIIYICSPKLALSKGGSRGNIES